MFVPLVLEYTGIALAIDVVVRLTTVPDDPPAGQFDNSFKLLRKLLDVIVAVFGADKVLVLMTILSSFVIVLTLGSTEMSESA